VQEKHLKELQPESLKEEVLTKVIFLLPKAGREKEI